MQEFKTLYFHIRLHLRGSVMFETFVEASFSPDNCFVFRSLGLTMLLESAETKRLALYLILCIKNLVLRTKIIPDFIRISIMLVYVKKIGVTLYRFENDHRKLWS